MRYKKGIAVNLIMILAIVGVIFLGLATIKWLGGKAPAEQLAALTTQIPAAPTGTPAELAAICDVCQYDGNTVKLTSFDKFDSSKQVDSINVRYKLNGGPSKTDADNTFDSKCGAELEVLWGAANSTKYYQMPETFTLGCAPNTEIVNAEMIQNNSITTLQCFNQEGNLIDDSTENETLALGDVVTLKCEMHGISKKGMPHGGIMVAEMNKTLYKENEFELTGLGSKVSTTPGAYSLTYTDSVARVWNVQPMEGAGVVTFFTQIAVEDSGATVSSTAGSDITLKLYDKNAFVEEDISGGPFVVAVEDLDSVFVSLNGPVTETIQVD